MKNLTIRSVSAAFGVAVCATLIVVGSYARDRVDLGGKTLAEAPLQNLVASRDNSSVPEGDYFYEIASLLKREYVEEIPDEETLATGAVRGMVGSLGDPRCLFMDKSEFASFLRRRQGQYEGIGVDLALVLPSTSKPKQTSTFVGEDGDATPADDLANGVPRIPRVTVVDVVPGGPADRAGVKPGDVAAYVDDHWVWSSDLIVRFRNAQRDWLAKKLDQKALNAIRKEVRQKTDRNLMPLKAYNRLINGKSGAVKIVWLRNGQQRTTTIQRGETTMPGFEEHGATVRLSLVPGSADRLRKAIAGKTQVTIDLTNNALGEFAEMKKCLAVLAPTGSYGILMNQRGNKPHPLSVVAGNPRPPNLILKVDATTRGAAQILAEALAFKKRATLQGNLAPEQPYLLDIVELPEGAGYTLTTEVYTTVLRGTL